MTSRSASRTQRSGTQTVERSFQLLKEICARNTVGATLPQLVKRFGWHRTTVHRLLRCMVRQGALRQDPASRKFYLGPLALELGLAVRPQHDLRSLFSSATARVAEKTGDTAFLIMRSGNDSVCIDRRLGSYPIKTVVVEIGTHRPLGIGAGSLAILGALPSEEIERIVSENERRLATYGRSPDAILRAAKAVSRNGFASVPVYGVEGATAVGVPILDAHGIPIAGLSVAAITQRMSRSRQIEVVKILREESMRLTALLRDANVVEVA